MAWGARNLISTTQVEGDKWEMYIPSELGYGDSGSPPKICLLYTSDAADE